MFNWFSRKPKEKTKGKYWSVITKHVFTYEDKDTGKTKYKIRASIMCGRDKWREDVVVTFDHLDQHDEALASLSAKAFEEVQNQYKRERIIAKMYELDKINNKLEMFAGSSLGEQYK